MILIWCRDVYKASCGSPWSPSNWLQTVEILIWCLEVYKASCGSSVIGGLCHSMRQAGGDFWRTKDETDCSISYKNKHSERSNIYRSKRSRSWFGASTIRGFVWILPDHRPIYDRWVGLQRWGSHRVRFWDSWGAAWRARWINDPTCTVVCYDTWHSCQEAWPMTVGCTCARDVTGEHHQGNFFS